MKKILRYVTYRRALTLSAGVYRTNFTQLMTPLFNIDFVSIQAGLNCRDTATSQSISGTGALTLTGFQLNKDNPAFVKTSLFYSPAINYSTGRMQKLDCYQSVSAGETFTLSGDVMLESVTANSVAFSAVIIVGYLCPEDYLSVAPFNL